MNLTLSARLGLKPIVTILVIHLILIIWVTR